MKSHTESGNPQSTAILLCYSPGARLPSREMAHPFLHGKVLSGSC